MSSQGCKMWNIIGCFPFLWDLPRFLNQNFLHCGKQHYRFMINHTLNGKCVTTATIYVTPFSNFLQTREMGDKKKREIKLSLSFNLFLQFRNSLYFISNILQNSKPMKCKSLGFHSYITCVNISFHGFGKCFGIHYLNLWRQYCKF